MLICRTRALSNTFGVLAGNPILRGEHPILPFCTYLCTVDFVSFLGAEGDIFWLDCITIFLIDGAPDLPAAHAWFAACAAMVASFHASAYCTL